MIQFTLNDEQEFVCNAAVDWYLHSKEQIFQYTGPPGAGKSVVLMEIVRRLGLDIATEVAPMSFIGSAALVMRSKGLFTAKTAHSWLYTPYERPKRGPDGSLMKNSKGDIYMSSEFKPKRLKDGIKLIIVDEGFCMPNKIKKDILKHGIKVLVCGDPNQLPPVMDTPAFLVDGKIYRLTKVMRQIGLEDIIFIADRAMKGLPLLNGYYGHSMVIDREDLNDNMLLWADVIITCTNKTRDKINNHIRYLKGYYGPMPNYGERVVCRNNNWNMVCFDGPNNTEIALVNGLIGTVVNQPDINTYNNKDKTFSMQFAPDMTQSIFNCDVNYYHMVSDSSERMKIRENSKYFIGEMFEYAYAITCHISQGSQFHKVIYIEEPMGGGIQPRLNLVGPTRADQQLIYVKPAYGQWPDYPNDPSLPDSVIQLRETIAQKVDFAYEYRENETNKSKGKKKQ